MPKKFQGENSKASAARARKEAAKQAEVEKKQKEADDQLWKDEDKHLQRKQQRKEEKDKKKVEQHERKALSKQLLEEEVNTLRSAKLLPTKVTQAQINMMKDGQIKRIKSEGPTPANEMPLEENLNRTMADVEQATTIDEALSVLSVKDEAVDMHPEKRMKAAYNAFEEANLPRLKAENSNLRLSQLKQMLKKDWMKSPENPLNKAMN